MQTTALFRINQQRQTVDRDCMASVKAIVCKHQPITPVRGGPVRTQAETPCGRPPLQLRCCAPVCASAVRAAGGREIPVQGHRNVGPRCQRRGARNRAAPRSLKGRPRDFPRPLLLASSSGNAISARPFFCFQSPLPPPRGGTTRRRPRPPPSFMAAQPRLSSTAAAALLTSPLPYTRVAMTAGQPQPPPPSYPLSPHIFPRLAVPPAAPLPPGW